MLERLAEALAESERTFLLRQLAAAAVRGEDRGHLFFSVPSGADALPGELAEIDSSYRDDDGGLIDVLLHFEQPRGVVSWLEWFRYDGKPVLRFPPSPGALTAPAVQWMPG